jgi:hypothetical protein
VRHDHVPAACRALPRSLGIPSPRWAVLPPSLARRGRHQTGRSAGKGARRRARDLGGARQSGSLCTSQRGRGIVPQGNYKQADRHSLPSDLDQAQCKEAGGARVSRLLRRIRRDSAHLQAHRRDTLLFLPHPIHMALARSTCVPRSRVGRQCGPPGWRGQLHQARDPLNRTSGGSPIRVHSQGIE